ncbi:MAG: hypothetical protein MRJ66_18960 [Nitrospira sp.]|nr:hypothetical protein [Nitrospira sp.]
MFQQLTYPRLLLLEEFGHLPLSQEIIRLLFRPTPLRYECKSLIVNGCQSESHRRKNPKAAIEMFNVRQLRAKALSRPSRPSRPSPRPNLSKSVLHHSTADTDPTPQMKETTPVRQGERGLTSRLRDGLERVAFVGQQATMHPARYLLNAVERQAARVGGRRNVS